MRRLRVSVYEWGCLHCRRPGPQGGLMHARWIWTTGVALAATLTLSAPAVSDENKNFVTHLMGEEQVPPVETDAQGEAIFHVSKDGTTISFKLIVANLEDVVAAHSLVAPAGKNGPIVVRLANGLIPGTSNGVPAVQIDRTIVGDAEQPRAQRLHLVELLQRVVGTRERVLDDVFPVGDRPGHPRAVAV